MLICPYCLERVPHEGRNKWFRCPMCNKWLCLREQNGLRWIESRVAEDEQMPSTRPPGEDGSLPLKENRPTDAITPQNVRELDLQRVRSELQRVTSRLRELTNDIGRNTRLQEQNNQSEQLVRQYDTKLRRLKQESEELKQYEERLTERENNLQEVATPTTGTGTSSPSGLIIGCGTILGFAGIMAFTRLINLHLDSRAFIWVILIAVVSGLLTWLIAQFNR
jgi:hypothetical protein